MAFGDVWHCPVCGVVFTEDGAMYAEPTRCPKCGYNVAVKQEQE